MSTKTRVLNVRVVGFSAPERQMLNSIFLLSVAPARQIGYKLWNPEAGVAPDMYLLDGDSESAVASWQATFSSTSDRTLVVGSKNADLGVASASRPLGLKVVGAMDRLGIALSNAARASAFHDVSVPTAGGTLPTNPGTTAPTISRPDSGMPRVPTGMTSQQPTLSATMNSLAPMSAGSHAMTASTAPATMAGTTMSTAAATTMAATMSTAAANAMAGATMSAAAANTMAGATLSTAAANTMAGATLSTAAANTMAGTTMTAAAPAATVLPSMTLAPNVAPALDKTINEKPLTERTVEWLLSDKPVAEKSASEKILASAAALMPSGVTPLSPSALSAAVAPANARTNLRAVPSPSPLAASLPSMAAAAARIADAPMVPPPTAPVAMPLPLIATQPMTPPAPMAQVAPVAPMAPVVSAAVPMPRHEEHNFRVLAVDDSPLMRTFLQNKLSPYGISPEFAASGEEALFKISKQHFDMIFLDVVLPGMDGYDVCKMIKKNKDNSLMKVVMLTSKDKTFDKIRGTMAGCDGYLTKPVDELKLRAIIERHTVTRK